MVSLHYLGGKLFSGKQAVAVAHNSWLWRSTAAPKYYSITAPVLGLLLILSPGAGKRIQPRDS